MKTSILFPLIALPISPATAYPYPSTWTFVPNLMTLGSTAITFKSGFLRKFKPVFVKPVHPLQCAVYAVALTMNSLTTCGPSERDGVLLLFEDVLEATFDGLTKRSFWFG